MEKIVEIPEGPPQRLPGGAGIDTAENVVHGLGDSLGRTYLDRVRHIVIAAAKTQRNDGPSPWAFAVHGRSLDDQSPRLPRCRYRYVTMVTD